MAKKPTKPSGPRIVRGKAAKSRKAAPRRPNQPASRIRSSPCSAARTAPQSTRSSPRPIGSRTVFEASSAARSRSGSGST
jgi:hypothetical protein